MRTPRLALPLRPLFLASCLVASGGWLPATADGHHGHDAPTEPASLRAAASLAAILQDNEAYVRGHSAASFAAYRDTQHPRATVVGCADSRFQTTALRQIAEDDLFVIRNIGNQLGSTPGSVDYGLRHLNTPLLIIAGHVSCGAVRAAMGDYAGENSAIRHELDGLHLSISRARTPDAPEQRWLALVQANVHQQVRFALRRYHDLVKAEKLFIVGGVYDFRNDLGAGHGRFQLIDVNGETDTARLEDLPLVKAARQRRGNSPSPARP